VSTGSRCGRSGGMRTHRHSEQGDLTSLSLSQSRAASSRIALDGLRANGAAGHSTDFPPFTFPLLSREISRAADGTVPAILPAIRQQTYSSLTVNCFISRRAWALPDDPLWCPCWQAGAKRVMKCLFSSTGGLPRHKTTTFVLRHEF